MKRTKDQMISLIDYVACIVGETTEYHDEASEEECIETAQLISAAPDMLAQLILVQAYLREKNVTFTGIDAAIDRAEGNTK